MGGANAAAASADLRAGAAAADGTSGAGSSLEAGRASFSGGKRQCLTGPLHSVVPTRQFARRIAPIGRRAEGLFAGSDVTAGLRNRGIDRSAKTTTSRLAERESLWVRLQRRTRWNDRRNL